MNIKSMLLRLQDVLHCDDLSQMVLRPEPVSVAPSSTEVKLLVGYDGSPKSQTALDLALWIAHQTRLIQRQQVIVQVVYVVSINPETQWQQADHVLWQARCLAEEWRGAFKTHLRVGQLATELQRVAISEAATLLFLGCHTAEHPLIQTLSAAEIPCAVLGVPQPLAQGNQGNDMVSLDQV